MKKYYLFILLASVLFACNEFFERGPENIILTETGNETAIEIEVGPDNAFITGNLLDLREDTGGDSLIALGHTWSTINPPELPPIPFDTSRLFPEPDSQGGTTNFARSIELGRFSSFMPSLTPLTPYFVRAYVINESGSVIYGNTISIVPGIVEMIAVVNISTNTAQAEGRIVPEFREGLSEWGHYISTSANPSPENNINDNNVDTPQQLTESGNFTTNIQGLSPNTTYFIRPYAINNQRVINYGETFVFSTFQN